MRSDAYGRILGALEVSGSPADVRFDFVSASQGIELVERLRAPEPAGAQPPAGEE